MSLTGSFSPPSGAGKPGRKGLPIEPSQVRLGSILTKKTDAIRAAGAILVEGGFIAPAYIESMLRREGAANTYLGHGIAIPHGQSADRHLIRQTGIAVLQLPQGVEWDGGERVRLVIAIAARDDDHLPILSALTDLLADPAAVERLVVTAQAGEIVAALRRFPGSLTHSDGASTARCGEGAAVEVTLTGRAGLHARPATRFAETAQRYRSAITVTARGLTVDGKSMAGLLRLGAERGTILRISVSGRDENEALLELKQAVAAGLGETEPQEARPAASVAPTWNPSTGMTVVSGLSGAPGFAVGPIQILSAPPIETFDRPADPASERLRFEQALGAAQAELSGLQDQLIARGLPEEAEIFRAHAALLRDPAVAEELHRQLARGRDAAWAWRQLTNRKADELAELSDPRLAARQADWRDLGQRLVRLMTNPGQSPLGRPSLPSIVVASDLSPSEVAAFDPHYVLGACTERGGPNAHAALLARALGIPLVVAAGPLPSLAAGATSILDGTAGKLYLAPSPEAIASAQDFAAHLAAERTLEREGRFLPAVFSDGRRIEIAANIGAVAEAPLALEAGAEGIGLLRTEFLFLNRTEAPSEDLQYHAYCEMLRSLGGLPLIVRTLDIGGDKPVAYFAGQPEENPALGVRGIRLCLEQPELFRTQLRAVYRAAGTGSVKIMFPMIATLEELRRAMATCEAVRQELKAPEIELGIMIEVPSAALLAVELAREVDFFSIGTNDLSQYVLAMDRQHPTLGRGADAFHPSVLRLIDQTVRGGLAGGCWIGACGGLAGEPLGAIILAGLGVTELSMSVPSIPGVKSALRKISSARATSLAQQALACATAEEVRALPFHP